MRPTGPMDATSSPAVRRGLVFACIAPHGDLALPEAATAGSGTGASPNGEATRRGMADLAARFTAANPEVVVVLTPHGVHVDGHFAVVVAGRMSGSLQESPGLSLDLPVDRALALAIRDAVGEAGLPVVGVSYGGNDPDEALMPLDWGTLIPLWYLGGRVEPPKPVVVVAPARDLSPDEHVAAGAALAQAAEASVRRVALVASADQSHTHLATGPYGFDPAARVLDELVVQHVRSGRLGSLRDLDRGLVEAAKPDSWWQMLMLAGAIGDGWHASLLSYEAPTYYGMLCAAFDPPTGT